MTDRRNVLFIVIDQLRADALSGALAGRVVMPNLAALKDEAVSFENHVSVTNPCGPSRASILTGQYAMNHRSVRNGTPLAADKPTLPGELRKGGWLPLLFGYTDTSPDPRVIDAGDPALTSYEQPMAGFVEMVEMRLEESWPWRANLRAKGYEVPAFADLYRPAGAAPDDPALYRAEDSDTAFLTDRFLDEIAARPQGWFAHLTYLRPHPPLVAPEPYNRMYDPAALPPATCPNDQAGEAAAHPFNGPAMASHPMAGNVVGFPDLPETVENVALMRALYLGLAREVDDQLGRILTFLKDNGLYDDTLLIVTADHGEMLGDHHAWGKMSYYDAAYRVPLILREPHRPGTFGSRIAQPTESVDVTPTILDLLGLDSPDTMDGRSLAPFLRGESPADWRDYSFSELDFGDPVTPTAWQKALGLDSDRTNLAVLRTARHTLVHFNGGLPPILFDHHGDGEARNIAEDPEAAPVLLELSRRMLDHRMTHSEGRFARTMITPEGAKRG